MVVGTRVAPEEADAGVGGPARAPSAAGSAPAPPGRKNQVHPAAPAAPQSAALVLPPGPSAPPQAWELAPHEVCDAENCCGDGDKMEGCEQTAPLACDAARGSADNFYRCAE